MLRYMQKVYKAIEKQAHFSMIMVSQQHRIAQRRRAVTEITCIYLLFWSPGFNSQHFYGHPQAYDTPTHMSLLPKRKIAIKCLPVSEGMV